ncbi:MAG: sigma-70 family RNA polymerase sigma factor [Phycisphaerae bacterium]|nr:sigma-70 family RNA polymerase sigma factor [Phycisphaerae bacterium]
MKSHEATIETRSYCSDIAEKLFEQDRGLYDLYQRIPRAISYMPHPSFDEPGAEERFFGPNAAEIHLPGWTDFVQAQEQAETPKKSPRPRLKAGQEAELFLRFNYARYRLSLVVESQQEHPTLGRAREMCRWFRRVEETQSAVTEANLALVVAMARRTRIPNVDFSELISEGNMALLRSIDKFDVRRGFKFSTYACRAILKSFNRLASKTGRYVQNFPASFEPEMERSDYDVKKHDMQREDSVDSLREILMQNRANLTETEQIVVMDRFAIGSEGRGRTLAQVGRRIGLTNERVRQIQKHALNKLRTVMDEEYFVA